MQPSSSCTNGILIFASAERTLVEAYLGQKVWVNDVVVNVLKNLQFKTLHIMKLKLVKPFKRGK